MGESTFMSASAGVQAESHGSHMGETKPRGATPADFLGDFGRRRFSVSRPPKAASPSLPQSFRSPAQLGPRPPQHPRDRVSAPRRGGHASRKQGSDHSSQQIYVVLPKGWKFSGQAPHLGKAIRDGIVNGGAAGRRLHFLVAGIRSPVPALPSHHLPPHSSRAKQHDLYGTTFMVWFLRYNCRLEAEADLKASQQPAHFLYQLAHHRCWCIVEYMNNICGKITRGLQAG